MALGAETRPTLQDEARVGVHTDRDGKAARVGGLTDGAPVGPRASARGLLATGRHVPDVTAFSDAACNLAEVRIALAARKRTVRHHFLGLFSQRTRLPRMSLLTSRSLAARTTRPAWQTPKPIREWRLPARATVFGHALFQLLDPPIRLGLWLFRRQQFRSQRFEEPIFFSQACRSSSFVMAVLSSMSFSLATP
jgi:hypothetical protein